jgi:Fic family protein
MRNINSNWIHEHENWTQFTWHTDEINAILLSLNRRYGFLEGLLSRLAAEQLKLFQVKILSKEIQASLLIEEENSDYLEVFSACARMMNYKSEGMVHSGGFAKAISQLFYQCSHDQYDGIKPQALKTWHRQLFGFGMKKTAFLTGDWRKDELTISSLRKESGHKYIHFQAVSPLRISAEMKNLQQWSNASMNHLHPALQSAIIHLWFLTIHPFEDGNGHIARAFCLNILSKMSASPANIISIGMELQANRAEYFNALETAQKSGQDISNWIKWYLSKAAAAIETAISIINPLFADTSLESAATAAGLNKRQLQTIKKLMNEEISNGFSSSQWAQLSETSQDTAQRDIAKLCAAGLLEQSGKGGRSTRFHIHTGLKKEIYK